MVSSEFISLTCSATISVECCHLVVAIFEINKITQEENDRWMYKLHLITSAIAGPRALMINCVAEEGMKGYFLEKNRPSTRAQRFCPKISARRQNSAGLVDVRERKGKEGKGRRSDPKKTFLARAAASQQQKKADSAADCLRRRRRRNLGLVLSGK